MDLTIETEQEAAVAILFSCIMHKHKTLSQSQIDHLSRTVVLCSKFKGSDLNALTVKAISLQSKEPTKNVLEQSAPLISENFRETLFAMICEAMTNDSTIDETESEVLGMAALFLNISVERMKMMLTTFLIRNRWNVHIIDQMHG